MWEGAEFGWQDITPPVWPLGKPTIELDEFSVAGCHRPLRAGISCGSSVDTEAAPLDARGCAAETGWATSAGAAYVVASQVTEAETKVLAAAGSPAGGRELEMEAEGGVHVGADEGAATG